MALVSASLRCWLMLPARGELRQVEPGSYRPDSINMRLYLSEMRRTDRKLT